MHREHLFVLFLIGLLLAAPPPGAHRARAERAEALGHMQEATREYEAAYDEEQAPDLLYRLGVTRRKLKQYAKAREAFRAYLRVAPDGGLREEVERQLAKLEVLIEAQAEDFSEGEKPRKPPAPVAAAPVPPPAPVISAQPAPAIPAPPPPVISAPAEPAISAPPEAVVVPRAALAAAPDTVVAAPARSRVAPLLAGGAAVIAGAGAYFWWDGARISDALDSRYARGDLVAGDRPLYGRAHAASVTGRVLVAAGVALGAAAVVLW